jgi:hypothetical protein
LNGRLWSASRTAKGSCLQRAAELDGDDRASWLSFLDALVTRPRIKRLTADIS